MSQENGKCTQCDHLLRARETERVGAGQEWSEMMIYAALLQVGREASQNGCHGGCPLIEERANRHKPPDLFTHKVRVWGRVNGKMVCIAESEK